MDYAASSMKAPRRLDSFATLSNIYRYIPINSHKTLTHYIPEFSRIITLSIGETANENQCCSFWVHRAQTDRQIDRQTRRMYRCLRYLQVILFLMWFNTLKYFILSNKNCAFFCNLNTSLIKSRQKDYPLNKLTNHWSHVNKLLSLIFKTFLLSSTVIQPVNELSYQ